MVFGIKMRGFWSFFAVFGRDFGIFGDFCSIFALLKLFLIKITTFLLVFCSKLIIFDGFEHKILIFCSILVF